MPVADLVVGDGLDRAAGLACQLDRVGTVRRVADRQRLGDRVRLDRAADVRAGLEGLGHRRAAGGLRAVHDRHVAADEPEIEPLAEALARSS